MALMIFFCLLLVALCFFGTMAIIGIYLDCRADKYGDGYFMMIMAGIPGAIVCVAGWGLYFMLVQEPFWTW